MMEPLPKQLEQRGIEPKISVLNEERKSRSKKKEPALLEWIVAFAGFALVLATLIFLFYKAMTNNSGVPDVTAQIISVNQTGNGYLVRIKAVNFGGASAAHVKVTGRLKNGDEEKESSEINFDYIPARSEREGGLFFKLDPRMFDLQLKAEGYEEP